MRACGTSRTSWTVRPARPPLSFPSPSFSHPARPPALAAGVLCQANMAVDEGRLTVGDAAAAVFSGKDDFASRTVKLGVHAQVFTLTNDAAHDYPL